MTTPGTNLPRSGCGSEEAAAGIPVRTHAICPLRSVGPTDGGSAAHFRAQVQFSIDSNSQDDEVWVLLTRHIRSHRAKDEFIALTAHTEDVGSSTTGGDVLSTKVRAITPGLCFN